MLCAAVCLSVMGQGFGQNPSRQATPSPTPAVKISPADQASFDLAKNDDESGATQQAIADYKQFIKGSPASPLASKAQYRIAELFEAAGELSKAFDAYQTLLTRYPDTPEFEKSVTRQVVIANTFLSLIHI